MMSSLQMSDATALQPHPKVVWLIHSKLNKNENPAFHFIYSFTMIFFSSLHIKLCVMSQCHTAPGFRSFFFGA